MLQAFCIWQTFSAINRRHIHTLEYTYLLELIQDLNLQFSLIKVVSGKHFSNKKRTLKKYFTFQLLSFQRGLVQTIYSVSNYIVHMYNLRHIICLLGTGVRISMEFKWVPTSFVSSEVLSSYTLLPYQVV